MEFILQIVATVMVFTSSLFGLGGTELAERSSVESVEIGLAEISPAGEDGGFAVPASGCAYLPSEHGETGVCTGQPTIEVDPPLVRIGEDVTVTWAIGGHVNCALTGKDIAGAVSAGGNQDVTLNSEITFTVTCDSGTASAVGKVLPQIQET